MKYKIIFATQWQEFAGTQLVEEADHDTIELSEEPTEPKGLDELRDALVEWFADEELNADELSVEETAWGWEISSKDENGEDINLAFISKFPME
jgi:hypothetical protein